MRITTPAENALKWASLNRPADMGRGIDRAINLMQFMAGMEQNSLPKPRSDAPAKESPKPWETGMNEAPAAHAETEPAPGTAESRGVPIVQAWSTNSPRFDPEAGLAAWQRTSTIPSGGEWMTQTPARNPLRAHDAAEFTSMIYEAKTPEQFDRVLAANSDWMNRKPIQRLVDDARQSLNKNLQFTHQQKMERIAQEGRDIQAATASGMVTLAKSFSEDLSGVIANGNPAERAQATALLKIPLVELPGGVKIPDDQARLGLAELMSSQSARIAKENGLVATGFEGGRVKYGRPRVDEVEQKDTFVTRTFYDDKGKPTFEALVNERTGKPHQSIAIRENMPPDAKAQMENNKSAIAMKEKEMAAAIRKSEDTGLLAREREAAKTAAEKARGELQSLWDQRVNLSTNWQGRASSGVPSNDPLGLFTK